MAAAANSKNETAKVLYQRIANEAEGLEALPDDVVRLSRLEQIARIYALVAEAPAARD